MRKFIESHILEIVIAFSIIGLLVATVGSIWINSDSSPAESLLTRKVFEDGLECVTRYGGGVDCNWDAYNGR
jgi:hypothetical protein